MPAAIHPYSGLIKSPIQKSSFLKWLICDMLPPPKQPLGSLHPACNHCDLWHVWSYLSKDSASMSKLLHELDWPDKKVTFPWQKKWWMFRHAWTLMTNIEQQQRRRLRQQQQHRIKMLFLVFLQDCQRPKNKTSRWTRKQCLSNPSDCQGPNGPPCHTRQLKDFDQIRTRCLGLLYHWTRISYRWFRTHEENRTSQTLQTCFLLRWIKASGWKQPMVHPQKREKTTLTLHVYQHGKRWYERVQFLGDTVGGRDRALHYLHRKTNPRTPSLTLRPRLVVNKKEVEWPKSCTTSTTKDTQHWTRG